MAGGLEDSSDYIQLIELWMCVGVLSKGVNNCCLQNTSPSFNMLNYVESCVGLQSTVANQKLHITGQRDKLRWMYDVTNFNLFS